MTPVAYAVSTYLFYVAVSMALTIWVARTLHGSGRVFLVETFHGDTALADSVNRLLVVGFYLINAGYVLLALREDTRPGGLIDALELVSTKLGTVLLVLGAMHFLNLYVFARMRRAAILGRHA